MRRLRTAFSLLIVLSVVVAFAAPAHAYEATYTVRVFAGDYYTGEGSSNGVGRFADGSNVIVYDNLSYGDTVPFSLSNVTINPTKEDRYIVRGVREAGKDNQMFFPEGIPEVTRDMDYVVAYRIPGAVTTYTLQYLDAATGEDLSSRVTRTNGESIEDITVFRGYVGEKPVMSYRYIEGYNPQYRSVTKTLTEDPAQNVLTLYYNRIVTATPASTATTATGGAAAGNAAGNAGADANAADNTVGAQDTGTAVEEGAEATAAEEATGTTEVFYEPEEILDLDVPLANFSDLFGGSDSSSTGTAERSHVGGPLVEYNGSMHFPRWMVITFIAVLALAVGTLYWYLLFYRKKKKYASYTVE